MTLNFRLILHWIRLEINKDIPIPVYYQLKEIIREKIENGELKIGEKITLENKLSKIYQISRMAVRQASAKKALYFLRGESPYCVRSIRTPIPNVASNLVTIR